MYVIVSILLVISLLYVYEYLCNLQLSILFITSENLKIIRAYLLYILALILFHKYFTLVDKEFDILNGVMLYILVQIIGIKFLHYLNDFKMEKKIHLEYIRANTEIICFINTFFMYVIINTIFNINVFIKLAENLNVDIYLYYYNILIYLLGIIMYIFTYIVIFPKKILKKYKIINISFICFMIIMLL